MPKVAEVEDQPGYYIFDCPGCGHAHFINTNPELYKVVWNFNKDLEKPTVSPSLNVTWNEGPDKIKKICHMIITDGKIYYCPDSTNHLAGQTVDMIDI